MNEINLLWTNQNGSCFKRNDCQKKTLIVIRAETEIAATNTLKCWIATLAPMSVHKIVNLIGGADWLVNFEHRQHRAISVKWEI
jgi:hypothetical protein